MAGYFEKSLTLPGILGADLETCPLPTTESNGFQKANWRDAAPHEAHSISVDEGVQLEVLDFGGTGSPHPAAARSRRHRALATMSSRRCSRRSIAWSR